MKKIYSLAAILFWLSASIYSQVTEITADTIYENSIWSDTVMIMNDVTIDFATTITIQPGTEIQFQGFYMINVKGNIKALGTSEDTIVFTRKDTLGFHDVESDAGGWNGIVFDDSDYQMWQSDSSHFRFCKFEHSKSTTEGDMVKGGVFTIKGFPRIKIMNCLFKNNASRTSGGAIFLEGDLEPEIHFCSFINNSALDGGAISLNGKARSVIYYCLFYKNNALQNGGAIFSSNAKGNILNCTFSNNSAEHGGAITLNSSRDRIIGNLIINNYATVAAGGIKVSASWPEFYNNTVCFNHGNWGGGIEFWSLCNADFFNNIIWGNTNFESYESNQVRISSLTATPNFYNCIIQGGTDSIEDYLGHSANIITNDPQFIIPSLQTGLDADGLDANLEVESFSPAINQGSNDIKEDLRIEIDLRGNPRILHGIIDIGAYEKQLGSFDVSDTIREHTTWIADTVRVNSDIVVLDSVILNIAPGTYIEFQDKYKLEVMGTLHAIGSREFPITFSVHDTNGFWNHSTDEGCWGGIVFDNSQFGANAAMNDNDSSRLQHCIIQYAKNRQNNWDAPTGGALLIRYFSNLEISNCTIQYNQADNGGGIGIDMFSHPYIHDNVIYRNFAKNDGGGLFVGNNSKPRIINNFILNNKTYNEYGFPGGGGLKIYIADPIVMNNVICNNYASRGGGIYMDESNPKFLNNTICNNQASFEGGGMYLFKSTPDIINSVFWGNSAPNDEDNKNQAMVYEDVNFYHNNIEGGIDQVIPWWYDYHGEYVANIQHDPWFKNPTVGPGPDFDALAADWSLTDYSANINRGHPESFAFGIPDKDIARNRRFNFDIIDIGAFENQGEPVHITGEPFNQVVCVGESVEFKVEVDGKALFQWHKNGDKIEGADTNFLIIDSVTLEDVADYICVVRNGYGLLLSNNVRLEVNAAPEILLQTESQWVREDASLKLEIHARGTEPVFYQWLKNGVLIQEERMPDFRINSMDYTDEGTYVCRVSNVCGDKLTAPITLFVAPQICMVTVDPETGDNLIIWEKRGIAPIVGYNVYRESIVAGEYDSIGHVPYDSISYFLDTIADPETQAYIYKITALNDDGYESSLNLCKPHKTIHLLTTTNLTTFATQLDWDHYYGFTYGTFHIYRSLTESNFTLLSSKSSSTTEYTDPNPEKQLYYYRIGVERPGGCSVTGDGKKADTGPWSHSMSNIDDNRLQTTGEREIHEQGKLSVYPNPFNESALITFLNPTGEDYTLKITDLSGKVCRITNHINTSEFVLEKGGLREGLYFIELSGPEVYRARIVIE